MSNNPPYVRSEFCDKCNVYSVFVQTGSNTLSCKKCGNNIPKYRIDYQSVILAIISSCLFMYGVWYFTSVIYYPLLFLGFIVWFGIFSIARVVFTVMSEREFK